MEDSYGKMLGSQSLGFSARASARTSGITFGRDTLVLEQRVTASRPQQQAPRPVPLIPTCGKVGDNVEKNTRSDAVLVNLVNFHSKLLGSSGRSFDLVVGKVCHLLKTNGQHLDATYKDALDGLFFSIRTLILNQEKSELSRTRLLEVLELRAKAWGQDPSQLSKGVSPVPPLVTPPAHPGPESAFQNLQSQYEGRYSPGIPEFDLPHMTQRPTTPTRRPPTPTERARTPLTPEQMTHLAMSIPFPDDATDEEDQWETLSDGTYESNSSDESILPEMQDLMLESTTDLDRELSRLLASKTPDLYRRTVNDGKPVRYTKSFLLNCWKSPFTKEMPPVLRHTISHSDVSFVIERHAFTDPKDLFTSERRDQDLLLMRRHLSLGSDPRDQSGPVQSSDHHRRRTVSCSQEGTTAGGGGGRVVDRDIGGGGERTMTMRYHRGMDPETTLGGQGAAGGDADMSWRKRYPSGEVKQMTEGAMQVRFAVSDAEKYEGDMKQDKNPWKPVSSTSNVLLTPKQIQGDRDLFPVPSRHQSSSPVDDNNNCKWRREGGEVPMETESSPSPLHLPGIPTFSEVFKEVIEKGLTAAPPAADCRTPPPPANPRTPSPADGYSLRPRYQVPESKSGPKPVPLMAEDAYRRGWSPSADWGAQSTGVLGPQPSSKPGYGVLGPYPGCPSGQPVQGSVHQPAGHLPYGMGGRTAARADADTSYVPQAK